MDLQLRSRTAFVSGSTGGIGYAIADALVSEGARVVVNGRADHRVEAAITRLREGRPDAEVSGVVADFADPSAVDELLERSTDVDILINNVGIFRVAAFESVDDAEWQRYFDVNVMSGVRLSRALLPRMLERGWGRIVFVSSEAGVSVPADMIHYGVGKAAQIALANGLAKCTRGTGVTVNTVIGGPTLSDGVSNALEEIARTQHVPVDAIRDAVAAQNTTSLIGRFIEPSEVASTVAYLASPLSSATNGTALRVDGGTLTTTL